MQKSAIPMTLIATLALSGCGSLASYSSGHVGCPPSDIKISDDHTGWNHRTWTARCHGKRYFCEAHGGGDGSTPQLTCAPEVYVGDDSVLATRPSPARSPEHAYSAPIGPALQVRKGKNDQGDTLLQLHWRTANYELRITAAPLLLPDAAKLRIGVFHGCENCAARLAINGKPGDLGEADANQDPNAIQLTTPLSTLQSMAEAERVALRFGETELVLTTEQRNAIKDLLVQVSEELTFSAQPSSAEAPPPSGNM